MLKDFDWEDMFLWLLWAVLVVVLTSGTYLVLAPHKVDGYYVSSGQNGGRNYCAYAHWTNHPDEVAFCSDDIAKVIEATKEMNAVGVPK